MVSPATAERVLRAARSLGYRPNIYARSLKTARSDTVGVVIPDLTNPLVPPMVRGAEDVLLRAGYNLLVVNTDGDPDRERAQIQALRARQVEGLIVATARLQHPYLETLHAEGRAARAGQPSARCGAHPVGHRRQRRRQRDGGGAPGGARPRRGSPTSPGRRTSRPGWCAGAATCRGCATAGWSEDPDLLVTCAAWTEEEGARAFGSLLDRGVEVTAVVAGHDRVALGGLRRAGRHTGCPAPRT